MGRYSDFRNNSYKYYPTKKSRNDANNDTISNDVYYDRNRRRAYRKHNTFKTYHRGQQCGGNRYSYRNIRERPSKRIEKPPSPVPGSEEYMVKKIEQTSALIMRQLLSPNEAVVPQESTDIVSDQKKTSESKDKPKQSQSNATDKDTDKSERSKPKKDIDRYSVEEIYYKIINHIGKLKDGKKKNLINSKESGYDPVVNRIATHQRLEISRALRMMCSDPKIAETDFINSIIPDIGIKLEDLPREFIEQLSLTFDTPLEIGSEPPRGKIFSEIFDKTGENLGVSENTAENVYFLDTASDMESEQHTCEDISTEKSSKDKSFHSNFSTAENTDKVDPEQSAERMIFPEPRLTEDQVLFNNIKTEPPDECYSASEETMMKVPVSPTKDENEIFLNDIKQESLDTEDLKELEDTSQNDDILKNGTRNINKDPDGHSTDLGTASIATQTDSFEELPDVGCWLKKTFRSPPKDISEAVDRMFRIDQIISDLNQYRQSLFTSFVIRDNSAHKMQKRGQLERFVSYSKKARQDGDVSLPPPATSISDEISEAPVQKDGEPVQETRGVNFELHEKVLSTRVDGNMLLAGTESGKLYMHDLSGTTELKSITVSEQPVISVISVKDATTSEILAASFDNTIRMYDVHGLKLTRTLNTEGMVQCMDEKWEYVFMGTSNGYLMRYSLKKNEIEFEEKFNDDCILTLKAISEGARKVLLVGSKGAPVCFRDAISGLHLRTLQHNSPRASVFSIIVDVNVYCATDNHVQVFSFHEGTVIHTLKAETKKQISCIRQFKKLLFASCENGNIYIYSTTQNNKIGCIEGPGGSILSMEVVGDKVSEYLSHSTATLQNSNILLMIRCYMVHSYCRK
ncbi:unnamed protein product [Acanthoscelides obtectus]|uniref:Uncharacterized protein n=1 Tax=Acanthoscelides obtectus TaxID=200917 RepID=A0A9P0P3E7_ACAOB|nr:unnamed protein product [Acanthoscelides obtectus]CAK1676819.1 Zinc finger protein 106 [Acanthoscelides obtectus]